MYCTAIKHSISSKVFSCFTILSFLFTSIINPVQAAPLTQLPVPGAMMNVSEAFVPVLMKGMTVNLQDPFQFDFIVHPGDTAMEGEAFKDEAQKLVKYFLASLTVPEDQLWVNLSPYEKDRIIPEHLGQTDMGYEMLAQDYILKQLTASLMYPEGEVGKKFWEKVYAKAAEQGITDVPMDTFNKVWIVPNKVSVYEHRNHVFIVENTLKVMLEEDYMAREKSVIGADHAETGLKPVSTKTIENDNIKSVIRSVIIPVIEKEVNEGKNFAPLRQIYNGMLLAAWYKKRLKQSVLGQVYADQNKVAGIDAIAPSQNEAVWDRYVQAFQKGAYDYIGESYDSNSGDVVSKKYFSGGLLGPKAEEVANAMLTDGVDSKLAGSSEMRVRVGPNAVSLTDEKPLNDFFEKQMTAMAKINPDYAVRAPAYDLSRPEQLAAVYFPDFNVTLVQNYLALNDPTEYVIVDSDVRNFVKNGNGINKLSEWKEDTKFSLPDAKGNFIEWKQKPNAYRYYAHQRNLLKRGEQKVFEGVFSASDIAGKPYAEALKIVQGDKAMLVIGKKFDSIGEFLSNLEISDSDKFQKLKSLLSVEGFGRMLAIDQGESSFIGKSATGTEGDPGYASGDSDARKDFYLSLAEKAGFDAKEMVYELKAVILQELTEHFDTVLIDFDAYQYIRAKEAKENVAIIHPSTQVLIRREGNIQGVKNYVLNPTFQGAQARDAGASGFKIYVLWDGDEAKFRKEYMVDDDNPATGLYPKSAREAQETGMPFIVEITTPKFSTVQEKAKTIVRAMQIVQEQPILPDVWKLEAPGPVKYLTDEQIQALTDLNIGINGLEIPEDLVKETLNGIGANQQQIQEAVDYLAGLKLIADEVRQTGRPALLLTAGGTNVEFAKQYALAVRFAGDVIIGHLAGRGVWRPQVRLSNSVTFAKEDVSNITTWKDLKGAISNRLRTESLPFVFNKLHPSTVNFVYGIFEEDDAQLNQANQAMLVAAVLDKIEKLVEEGLKEIGEREKPMTYSGWATGIYQNLLNSVQKFQKIVKDQSYQMSVNQKSDLLNALEKDFYGKTLGLTGLEAGYLRLDALPKIKSTISTYIAIEEQIQFLRKEFEKLEDAAMLSLKALVFIALFSIVSVALNTYHKSDNTALTPGGIDFNAAGVNMEIQISDDGFVFPKVDPAMLEKFQINGLRMNVIHFRPLGMPVIRQMLGMAPEAGDEDSGLSYRPGDQAIREDMI